jgi:hypothetical protein
VAQRPSEKQTRPLSASSTGLDGKTPAGPHFDIDIASFPAPRNTWLKLVRPRGTGYAVPEFSRACLIRLIDFPEMPFRIGVNETIKAGRSTLLVLELPVAGRMIAVAYKHVRRRHWVKRLTMLFRTNRVLRSRNWRTNFWRAEFQPHGRWP